MVEGDDKRVCHTLSDFVFHKWYTLRNEKRSNFKSKADATDPMPADPGSVNPGFLPNVEILPPLTSYS